MTPATQETDLMTTTTDPLPEWWVSWWTTDDLGSFTLHTPWWVTGHDSSGADSIVAEVRATIAAAYDKDPGPLMFRFCEPLAATPFSDRFPRADWMQW
jgi:hypothetical protein